jgi:hypothetical protein
MAELVIGFSLFGVRKDAVGFVDLSEFGFVFLGATLVRMVL